MDDSKSNEEILVFNGLIGSVAKRKKPKKHRRNSSLRISVNSWFVILRKNEVYKQTLFFSLFCPPNVIGRFYLSAKGLKKKYLDMKKGNITFQFCFIFIIYKIHLFFIISSTSLSSFFFFVISLVTWLFWSVLLLFSFVYVFVVVVIVFVLSLAWFLQVHWLHRVVLKQI